MLPLGIVEFLDELSVIGDHELRAKVQQYLEAWSDASKDTPIELMRHRILLGEPNFEGENRRRRLRELEFQLLAIAQHYGMPTPLIDWTASPYIAWYFALSEPKVQFPTVLALAPSAFEARSRRWLEEKSNQIRTEIDELLSEHRRENGDTPCSRDDVLRNYQLTTWSDASEFYFSSVMSHINERQRAQQGSFTRHSLGQTLEKTIRIVSHSHPEIPMLYRFVLVGSSREEALIDLRMMNVTGATLFPGLVGAARLGADSIRFNEYSAKVAYRDPYGTA